MQAYPKITLKAVRVNAGLSQAEAAKRLKISRSTLQHYEMGETVPDWDMVQRMVEVYQFPADHIFFSKNYA